MTEAELLREVITLALAMGLFIHHCGDSRLCEGQRGFPDLLIAGPRGVIFAELKQEYVTVPAAQRLAGYRIQSAGLDWHIWRPSDWAAGTIKREMEKIA